jgi:hypothetical protein
MAARIARTEIRAEAARKRRYGIRQKGNGHSPEAKWLSPARTNLQLRRPVPTFHLYLRLGFKAQQLVDSSGGCGDEI